MVLGDFSTFSPLFELFSLQNYIFLPKRVAGTLKTDFFLTPSGIDAIFILRFARLRWSNGALVLQPKKTPKTQKIPVFAKKLSIFHFKRVP